MPDVEASADAVLPVARTPLHSPRLPVAAEQ
jgi:hypothetical protein